MWEGSVAGSGRPHDSQERQSLAEKYPVGGQRIRPWENLAQPGGPWCEALAC